MKAKSKQDFLEQFEKYAHREFSKKLVFKYSYDLVVSFSSYFDFWFFKKHFDYNEEHLLFLLCRKHLVKWWIPEIGIEKLTIKEIAQLKYKNLL